MAACLVCCVSRILLGKSLAMDVYCVSRILLGKSLAMDVYCVSRILLGKGLAMDVLCATYSVRTMQINEQMRIITLEIKDLPRICQSTNTRNHTEHKILAKQKY